MIIFKPDKSRIVNSYPSDNEKMVKALVAYVKFLRSPNIYLHTCVTCVTCKCILVMPGVTYFSSLSLGSG